MNILFRSMLYFAIILILTVTLTFGQGLPMTSPEDVGLSSERLNRVDAVIQKAIDEEQIAGVVALIARHGKVAYLKSFGKADIEENKPMKNDAIFRIASMSKAITSTAVMILYEEGRFLLNDPVSKYIPEFKNPKVLINEPSTDGKPYTIIPAKREITIRHLLNHTSGISYLFDGREYIADIYKEAGISDGLRETEETIGDMVKKLARLPLAHQPGEVYDYSLSIDVLGYFVEVISGMTLDEFFRERIFKPLKMNDTYFFLPREKVSRLASVYRPSKDGGLEKLPEGIVVYDYVEYSSSYQIGPPRKHYSGGAGLVSTAMDYARFLQAMLNGGELDGERILSPKTVEFMTLPSMNSDITIGFGVKGEHKVTDELGTGSIGRFKWGGFFYTDFQADPVEDMLFVFMAQLHPATGRDIMLKFRNMPYQAIVK